ncbi:MAG: amidohydrolase family protein, partial [Lentimicrobiaceae bacterium]|nr:amidohydrolase family protein [Lentimicrobiaceae bacterium]
IAIRENLIIAVGNNQEILDMQNTETSLIDLKGKTIMPGIVDPHSHLFFGSELQLGLSFEESQQLAIEKGITTIGEISTTAERFERMLNFEQEGKLRIRTSLYLRYTNPCGELEGNWWMDHPSTDAWGEKLRIGGVKIFSDGGTCGTLAMSFEYPAGGHGDLWFTQEELDSIVAEINNAGFQVAIHAQGDLAVEQSQNAIESALNGQPNTLRHRIDHNAIVLPDMLTRYSEIGIVPVIFGAFPTCNEQGIIDRFGTEPLPYFENWNALLEANPGLYIAWHSDAPNLVMDPIYNLYSYVTRKEIADDGTICEPSDWLEAHAITVEQTLTIMTIGAAYALFRDDEVGSLKPGKLADIIILSDNPLTIEPDSLASIHVLMTMVDGIVEYCKPGNDDLCPGNYGISPLSDNPPFGSINSWPNPATDHTTIQVFLNSQVEGEIVLYNLMGKEIDVIYQGIFQIGMNEILYQTDRLANGIYFCHLTADNQSCSMKMVIVR